jgi:MerR family transcriptional regulator, copper efflux regulator
MIQIGELARRSGASVRSIRHYESVGLLASVRSAAGYRLFEEAAVDHIERIRVLLRNGFVLDEVRTVVSMQDPDPRSRAVICGEVIGLYRKKLSDISERIVDLQRVRDQVDDRLRVLEAQRAAGGPPEAGATVPVEAGS